MSTEIERAYLAGLMDGEGHIGITLARFRPNGEYRTHVVIVTIASTHLETLRWVRETWAHGTLVVRQQPKQRVPIGNLRWSSLAAVPVLQDVLPYLRIKAPQAKLALQFAAELGMRISRTRAMTESEWNQREELRVAIRQLNRPDPTVTPEPFPAWRYERQCLYCGTSFLWDDGHRRAYCSPECREKARWQRVRHQQTV